MPKAHNKTGMDKEVVVPPHGAINKAEAERHRQKLQQTINDLKTNATEPEIREIMGDFILATKLCCEEVYSPPPQKCRHKQSITLYWRPLRTSYTRTDRGD